MATIKYKKIAIVGGFTTILTGIFVEYYRFKRSLGTLINRDVLELNNKHPDYIYIKYSIYRESMARLRHKQQYEKNWINIMSQPFSKWWKMVKHSVAWHLLELAKTGDTHDRLKAVQQLAQIDHLKDWDYQHLAQTCDARTAISLARHNCDLRWFLQPREHGSVRYPKSLINEMRNKINLLRPSKCVDHFYATTLDKFGILKGYNNDEDNYEHQPFSQCRITKPEFECMRQCLDVLFHLTKKPEASEKLIEAGFLQTLMEIQKLFYFNNDMRFLLSKIMTNMSLCRTALYDFFVTGWIGILAEWSRSKDLRVQVTACKALANLDTEDPQSFLYPSQIYPLYPKLRKRQNPDVDLVFIHGLLGGVFVTWRQKDREEQQLGLYGKNAFYYTKSNEDDGILIEEFNKNNLRSVGKYSRNVTTKTKNGNGTTKNGGTVLYKEPYLISKNSEKRSNLTNKLIETLQTFDEFSDDWEVVFPDCPIQSNENAKEVFSVSGDKWINDDQNEDYTYCWPMDWLPTDYPNIRVLGVNYETSLSEWSTTAMNYCPCEKKGTLQNRSEEILNNLVKSGVGDNGRPIIWIGHSMGGLIAKNIITEALNSSDEAHRQIATNTKALLFLGTPHKGSPMAKLKQHISLIISPTTEVKELEENSKYLLNLHDNFIKFIEQKLKNNDNDDKENVEVVSMAEGSPTVITGFKFYLVQAELAKIEIGDYYVLNCNHLGLSKPIFRQSFLYQRLLLMIHDVLEKRKHDEN